MDKPASHPVDPAVGEKWLLDRVPPAHLGLLRRHGVVSRERRGDRTRYRLRYRCGGRQQARNIGSDPELAAAVAAALAAWQAERRTEVAGRRAAREVGAALSRIWRSVAPALAAAGYRLHGRTARRPRRSPGDARSSPPSRDP